LESAAQVHFEAFPIDREKQEFTFHRGKINITPFGRLFMDACLTQLRQSQAAENHSAAATSVDEIQREKKQTKPKPK
jgi:hypothetical protein